MFTIDYTDCSSRCSVHVIPDCRSPCSRSIWIWMLDAPDAISGMPDMRLTVTTWNINSVRLRIDRWPGSSRRSARTSCACRRRSVRTTGFRSSASSGSATSMSRSTGRRAITASRCSRGCRSRASTSSRSAARPTAGTSRAVLGERAGLRDPVTLHNFYVPAGGDMPDPDDQSEVRAQAFVPRRDARLRRAALPAAKPR